MHRFYSVWGMVSSVLPESVKRKISIIGDARGLDECIAADQRPPEYGGTGVELWQAPEHLAFLAMAESWIPEAPSLSALRSEALVTKAVTEYFGEGGTNEGSRGLLGWKWPGNPNKSVVSSNSQAFLGDKNRFIVTLTV
jgi:hypothetical protein